jgi:hypothetical protein
VDLFQQRLIPRVAFDKAGHQLTGLIHTPYRLLIVVARLLKEPSAFVTASLWLLN